MIYLKFFENFMITYPIQVPPNKEESIDLVINNGPSSWFINDVETSDKEVIRRFLSDDSELGARHEALHILQGLNIPEIFNNIRSLDIKSEWFGEIKENNFSLLGINHEKEFYDYFTLDYEIMAYAFSFILIKKQPDCKIALDGKIDESTIYEEFSDKIYQSIGGEFLDKFIIYCNQYEKLLV